MLYLNAAGTSWPKPPEVATAAHGAEAASPRAWGAIFAAAHATVAARLGVTDWLPTPSCTQALAVAVADVPWAAGDRVLTSSMEHHGLWRPLVKQGVQVVELPRGSDGMVDVASLAEALEAGGVKLVAMSMASNVTGEGLPWADVVELAHAHGALCLLDGAQVAGWVPLDLAALEVDLFAFAGHKGPQGPSGIGGLYVRPGLLLDSPAASCDGEVCRTGPGYCDTGSVSLAGLAGLAAGWAAMEAASPLGAALDRAVALRAWLAAQEGVTVHGGAPRVPTVSFTATRSPQELSDALAERGIVGRAGTQCAPRAHRALGTGEAGTMRLSFGPWGADDDVETVTRALAEVL